MAEGTYTLVCERTADGAIQVGALGRIEFPAGWYAYTGTAFGPGGFARVERHERVAAGEHDARHWHVDYLLGDPDTRIDHVLRSPDVDAECAISDRAAGTRIDDFGASDCGCPSHLAFDRRRVHLLDSLERAHRDLGVDP